MGWRSLVGIHEPKSEIELICESRHEWHFRRIAEFRGKYHSWAEVNDRRAFLAWSHRVNGVWCTANLLLNGTGLCNAQGNHFDERSFPQALRIAERFLDGHGVIEKRLSGYKGLASGPEEEHYCWVYSP